MRSVTPRKMDVDKSKDFEKLSKLRKDIRKNLKLDLATMRSKLFG